MAIITRTMDSGSCEAAGSIVLCDGRLEGFPLLVVVVPTMTTRRRPWWQCWSAAQQILRAAAAAHRGTYHHETAHASRIVLRDYTRCPAAPTLLRRVWRRRPSLLLLRPHQAPPVAPTVPPAYPPTAYCGAAARRLLSDCCQRGPTYGAGDEEQQRQRTTLG